LIVTSDFAGADLHANDGTGRFRDLTGRWLDDPKAFGMSHSFTDANADGRIDLFLVGMPQPTADRLDALGLERPDTAPWRNERARVVVGNRLFLGGPDGFRQSPVGHRTVR
jgi:hypothetical protein